MQFEVVKLYLERVWHSPPSHRQRSVFRCLLEGIIGIVWSLSQHEELLVHITVDKRQQCDWGEDEVRHEGFNNIGKAIGDSGITA